jgi:hypothetical protein
MADKAENLKRKGKAPLNTDADPTDLRSVAATVVCDLMEVYASKVVVPRTTGRGQWFPVAQVGRLITGFFPAPKSQSSSRSGVKKPVSHSGRTLQPPSVAVPVQSSISRNSSRARHR